MQDLLEMPGDELLALLASRPIYFEQEASRKALAAHVRRITGGRADLTPVPGFDDGD